LPDDDRRDGLKDPVAAVAAKARSSADAAAWRLTEMCS
jgi:hypothetical protein